MSSNVLANKDINAAVVSNQQQLDGKAQVKSMEYHRQVLQSKMAEEKCAPLAAAVNGHGRLQRVLTKIENRPKQYISPSDNIMSPCTAKLNAFRSKQVGK